MPTCTWALCSSSLSLSPRKPTGPSTKATRCHVLFRSFNSPREIGHEMTQATAGGQSNDHSRTADGCKNVRLRVPWVDGLCGIHHQQRMGTRCVPRRQSYISLEAKSCSCAVLGNSGVSNVIKSPAPWRTRHTTNKRIRHLRREQWLTDCGSSTESTKHAKCWPQLTPFSF